jgi:hypothetical protein
MMCSGSCIQGERTFHEIATPNDSEGVSSRNQMSPPLSHTKTVKQKNKKENQKEEKHNKSKTAHQDEQITSQ